MLATLLSPLSPASSTIAEAGLINKAYIPIKISGHFPYGIVISHNTSKQILAAN